MSFIHRFFKTKADNSLNKIEDFKIIISALPEYYFSSLNAVGLW